MYFKNPVTTLLHDNFYSYGETRETHNDFGTREAVMELDEAKDWIRIYKTSSKKFAYKLWLLRYKRLHPCIVCDERDPDKLNIHHLGEEYTDRQKKDRIANMLVNRRPLFEIEHEMMKCAVECANCHQKTHRVGRKALDDLYDLSERVYGKYYAPGDDTEKTKRLRKEFWNDLNDVEIELVDKNNSSSKTDQEQILAESIYQSGRRKCEAEDVAYLYSKMWRSRS